MIELTVVFVSVSILLYVLLGGADFGAGIIEIFTGQRGINSISKAIAPVWEANHIWLIVIVVIIFNAFPEVYSTVGTYLHIPLLLILFGIIFRGTAFTFRYYDPYEDDSHQIYTLVFKIFSVLTPFFLGVTIGAIILGDITIDPEATFYARFMKPWINLYSFMMGVFMVELFAFLAAVYLSGEPVSEDLSRQFQKYTGWIMWALIGTGFLVFVTAEIHGMQLLRLFINSGISMTSAFTATILLPFLINFMRRGKVVFTRITAGAITTAVIVGWFGVQFPVLVSIKNAEALTIYNTAAPHKTILMLVLALIIGLAIVIPLLVYLFKVFKLDREPDIQITDT